jgi:hypothetical protein
LPALGIGPPFVSGINDNIALVQPGFEFFKDTVGGLAVRERQDKDSWLFTIYILVVFPHVSCRGGLTCWESVDKLVETAETMN